MLSRPSSSACLVACADEDGAVPRALTLSVRHQRRRGVDKGQSLLKWEFEHFMTIMKPSSLRISDVKCESFHDSSLSKQVNLGLFKMYRAEVLLKFPVIQHFLFGTLLDMPAPARRAGHEGHGHDEKDDCETSHKYRCCCPITVPREDEDDSSSAVDPDPFNPTVVKPGVPIAGDASVVL